jgi:membrane fusion protein (multidrug efflux system)
MSSTGSVQGVPPTEVARPSTPTAPAAADASRLRRWLPRLAAVAVVAVAAAIYWAYERQFEETDDAQVDANISNLSPRVSGTIAAVHVVENQAVKTGELLAEIDPRDLQVALDLAKAQVAEAEAQLAVEDPSVPITEMANQTTVATSGADLASAVASLAQAKSAVDEVAAQLTQAEANDKNAQVEKRRGAELIGQNAITSSDYDKRTSAAAASSANVEALRQAVEAARAGVREKEARLASTQSRLTEIKANAPRQLATRRASVLVRQAALSAAKAQLAQAELNLSYTRITSPVAGIVGKKAVDVGDHVSPGQEILAISQNENPWVTANFRETQLRQMHPGQSVKVHVDAIDADLHGLVESIGGATGSRYSVLPPENASGNYVKVVQRIPVRIKLDPGQPGLDRLRAGMSVEPKVRL